MGYDTSGLRKVLDGGTGDHLLDGIFLDDYDANGAEVPEVSFTGTVYAEGAISVYIFKVGIRGEVIFTTNLDLHEDNPQDGKLRIEEIISRLNNPLCLFDVSGKIEAALSAFVEIDLFITSIDFSIEIVRITLLEFNLDVCEPEPPVLARVDVVSGVEAVLHMGNLTERSKRNIKRTRSTRSSPSGRWSRTHRPEQRQDALLRDRLGPAGLLRSRPRWNRQRSPDRERLHRRRHRLLLPGGARARAPRPAQSPLVPLTLRADISAGDGNDEITTGDA